MSTSWLVTGGTGSFGHAFVRRLLDGDASRVVVLSRDELKQAEMRQEFDDPRLRFFVGNVTSQPRVERAMRGVDYVVHAAAMKRIDTCEENPAEAVETNVLGTMAVAYAVIAAGVKRAVFLSTDKAAGPFTHYGATKLCAERLWIQANVYAAGTPTRLSATRYGNVIGSRGSVIPLWKEQAKNGEPLSITDPKMSRFWMTMQQAIDLVLLTIREMHGGEVFIPHVPSADMVTVAEAVAPRVPRKIVGVRRGEKLHETLISEDEARDTQVWSDHYRIEPERTWTDDDIPTRQDQFPSLEGYRVVNAYRSDTNPWQLSVEEMRDLICEPQ